MTEQDSGRDGDGGSEEGENTTRLGCLGLVMQCRLLEWLLVQQKWVTPVQSRLLAQRNTLGGRRVLEFWCSARSCSAGALQAAGAL
jgi:hypothetical protein